MSTHDVTPRPAGRFIALAALAFLASLVLGLAACQDSLLGQPLGSVKIAISAAPSASCSLNTATIAWQTSVEGFSWVEYGTVSGVYDKMTVRTATARTSHSVALSDLQVNTRYYYIVHSTHSSGATVASAMLSFTTGQLAIDSAAVATPTATGATITWTTNQAAVAWVEYGTVSGAPNKATARSASTATPSASLTDLSTGVTYYYKVYGEHASGAIVSSAEASFTTVLTSTTITATTPSAAITAAPAAPAVIPDTTSAALSFSTNYAGKCFVEWGSASGSYGNATSLESSYGTSHNLTMTSLAWSRGSPSPASTATYYYRVHSFSLANGATISPEYTLTTPVITDATLSQRLRGIWIIGGVSGPAGSNWTSALAAVHLFDPGMGSDGTWYTANIPALPTPVSFAATCGYNGKIFVFGGFESGFAGAVSTAAQVYNVATNAWATGVPPLSSGRAGATAAVASGKIYVFGGVTSAANAGYAAAAANATMWEYSPVSPFSYAVVTPSPTLATAASERAAVGFDDVVYHLGGRTGIATLTASPNHDGFKVSAPVGVTTLALGVEQPLSAPRIGMSLVLYRPANKPATMIVCGGASSILTPGTTWIFSTGAAGTAISTVQYLSYPFVSPATWQTPATTLLQPLAFGAAAIGTNSAGTVRLYCFGGTNIMTAAGVRGLDVVYSNDLSTYAPATPSLFPLAWTSHPTVMPSGRFGHAAVTVQ